MEPSKPNPTSGASPCLKDAVHMSEKDIEFLYGLAYNFFSHGRYKVAEPVFSVLAMCDPTQPRFWLGLGESRQKQGRYHEALVAYGWVFGFGNQDCRAALHIAECMYALHHLDAAGLMLDAAERSLGNVFDHSRMAERIAALRCSVAKAHDNDNDSDNEAEGQPESPIFATATAY